MRSRQVITSVCRILVGVLFIFSGFVKADDPMGFGYKLQEYFGVFGIEQLNPIAFYLSMLFSTFEIFLGFTLLLGVWRKFTSWMLLLLIVFFSFLTFYSAYFNKVTDCGCFGDAIHLSPWQSFSKDLILLVLILVIVWNRKLINPIFRGNTGKDAAGIFFILALVLNVFAFVFLPPINFRPYQTGNDIAQMMKLPPDAKKDSILMTFIYEKNGKTKALTMDQIGTIDSTWTFKDREDKVIREGDKPLVHDFSIYTLNGENVTDKFLKDSGYKLMIVQWDLELSNTNAQSKVNELAKALNEDNKITLWPVTSSSRAIITVYSKQHEVPYSFYQMDNTVLKTIIRSNPGILLLDGDKIIARWPSTWLPSKEKIYSYLK
jgi:uncharacterized membrane protein YphA (DoxX/SURF4 family)